MAEFRDRAGRGRRPPRRHYGELKAAARRRLGQLFDPADYPRALHGLFGVDWDFPSVEPPDYLLQLSPALYEQEQAGWPPGSRRRCSWPSRRSSTSSPSWWPT